MNEAEILRQLESLQKIAGPGTINAAYVITEKSKQIIGHDQTFYQQTLRLLVEQIPFISKLAPKLIQGAHKKTFGIYFRYEASLILLKQLRLGYIILIINPQQTQINTIKQLCAVTVQNLNELGGQNG
jgi:hypothetical protein